MKKLLTAILSLSLLGAAALPALAADSEPPMVISPGPLLIAPAPEEDPTAPGFAVEVDGERVDIRACVMVPVRAMAEQLGFAIAWDDGVVTITGPERYVRMTIGEDRYFAAPTQEEMLGASLFSLGSAPYLSNDSTYAPVGVFEVLLGSKEGAVILEENTVRIDTGAGLMNTVQIPSPFTDHDTLTEAADAVGFALSAPEQVSGSSLRAIQTMDSGMIQVFYGDDDDRICIRKALGSEDISGDYNVYAQITAVDADGISVTMKGENGLVHLAIWTSGGYTYAVSIQAGMSAANMSALVRLVK